MDISPSDFQNWWIIPKQNDPCFKPLTWSDNLAIESFFSPTARIFQIKDTYISFVAEVTLGWKLTFLNFHPTHFGRLDFKEARSTPLKDGISVF